MNGPVRDEKDRTDDTGEIRPEFTKRMPAGATRLMRDCDIIKSVTNVSPLRNSMRVLVAQRAVVDIVLPGHASAVLVGAMGLPVIKVQHQSVVLQCEHPVDLACRNLPVDRRRAIAQAEPLFVGEWEFSQGTVRRAARRAQVGV